MSKQFVKGSIVRYKNPLNESEKNAKFVVTEDKGDRVNITLLGSNLPYLPTECVSTNEIVLADNLK